MPAHILLINHEFPPVGGGAATAAAQIAREMARLGVRVTVLTSAHAGLPRREERDGYVVERLAARRRRRDSSNILEMLSFLFSSLVWVLRRGRARRPEVCLAFFGLPGGPAAWLLRKTAGVPYIISLRGGDVPGFLPESLGRWHLLSGPVIRFLWRRAEFVVANSRGLARLALRSAPWQAIEIISNGVDVPPAAAPDGRGRAFAAEGARLISVGRLNAQKNYPALLEALAGLSQAGWRLEIIGDGPEGERLRALAGRLGLSARISFSGWLDRAELRRRLAAADIFVFPSIQEGMPNAVLEAMAAALPVVACAVEGCEELVADGETGLLTPPADVEALRLALARLLADPALCRRLGLAGRARAEERYAWRTTAEAYLRLCAAANRPAARAGH
ncbi:MAG: glycosyltransferase [Candidatus Adiutrix sp.]|jgi:glycosyltransferase involved in cell wall biosynthesis|nr:glycosyltransferase [Candidatus Adiutrix sp.]